MYFMSFVSVVHMIIRITSDSILCSRIGLKPRNTTFIDIGKR